MSMLGHLQLLSSSHLFGLFLTIFYRKDFTFRKYVAPRGTKIIILGLFWASSQLYDSVYRSVVTLGIILAFFRDAFPDLAIKEKVKSVVLSTTLLVIHATSGDTLAGLAVSCAFTQFLRWPTSVKNYLRELRIIFGPVYALLAIGACAQSDFKSNLFTTSTCAVSLAAIFLRPDNNEVLQFVVFWRPINPSTQTRKWIHGCLMFLSMICLIWYLAIYSNIGRMFLAGITCTDAFNVLLYIFVADFPRKIWRWIAMRRFAAGQERE